MLTMKGFEKALEYWQLFLQGVVCTISLSALTVIFGFILALVIATCRMGRSRILKAVSTAYVELFRATPMVVQVFLIYYVVFDGVTPHSPNCRQIRSDCRNTDNHSVY